MTNATPITCNVSFHLFLEIHFHCFEDSSPFHDLFTFLTQEDLAPFFLLIIIIFTLSLCLLGTTWLRDISMSFKRDFEMNSSWSREGGLRLFSLFFCRDAFRGHFKNVRYEAFTQFSCLNDTSGCVCCSPIHITPICTAEVRQVQQGIV